MRKKERVLIYEGERDREREERERERRERERYLAPWPLTDVSFEVDRDLRIQLRNIFVVVGHLFSNAFITSKVRVVVAAIAVVVMVVLFNGVVVVAIVFVIYLEQSKG